MKIKNPQEILKEELSKIRFDFEVKEGHNKLEVIKNFLNFVEERVKENIEMKDNQQDIKKDGLKRFILAEISFIINRNGFYRYKGVWKVVKETEKEVQERKKQIKKEKEREKKDRIKYSLKYKKGITENMFGDIDYVYRCKGTPIVEKYWTKKCDNELKNLCKEFGKFAHIFFDFESVIGKNKFNELEKELERKRPKTFTKCGFSLSFPYYFIKFKNYEISVETPKIENKCKACGRNISLKTFDDYSLKRISLDLEINSIKDICLCKSCSENKEYLENLKEGCDIVKVKNLKNCLICNNKMSSKKEHIESYSCIINLPKVRSFMCPSCIKNFELCHHTFFKKFYPNRRKKEFKQNSLKLLTQLYLLLERVPSRNDWCLDLIEHLSKEKRIKFYKLMIKFPYQEYYKEMFGSYFEALIKSGVLKESVRKLSRGTMCKAEDGHICLSIAEMNVDNWLFKNKIKHEKEPKYPKDDDLNPKKLFRADWKIGSFYVEFFGLKGSKDYDLKIELKRELCNKKNLKLIEINREDFKCLGEKLNILKN